MPAEVVLVAGYIRVSTREQAEKGYSPEVQRHRITEYCQGRFVEGACQLEFFEDLGETGGVGLRQHPDLFRHCRPGLSDAIDFLIDSDGPAEKHFVALDQSRLERDPLLWQVLVEVYARRCGIVFHFVDEGGEMSLDDLSLMARGLTSLANASYRRQTGRRVREAAEHRARQGYHHGDPPFGWRKLPKPEGQRWAEIAPDPEQAPIVERMKDLILRGWGSVRTAAWLDAQGIPPPSGGKGWYPETVRAVLLNPVHAGYVRHRDEIYRGRHYDRRLWDIEVTRELERIIKQRQRSSRRGLKLGQFMLAGMLTCGHCGRALTAWRDNDTASRYYGCIGRAHPLADSHPAFCKLADKMEVAVVDCVGEVLSSDLIRRLTTHRIREAVEKELKELRVHEERLRKKKQEAVADLSQAISLYRRGDLDEASFEAVKAEYERKIEAAENELARIKQRREYVSANKARLRRAQEAAKDFTLLWDQLDTEERRGILQALIDEILVYREGRRSIRLVIEFHFLPPVERRLGPVKDATLDAKLARLTERELAFLELWERGLRYREIARQFDVSYAAARQFTHSIRRKLEVDDVQEAVRKSKELRELYSIFLPLSGRVRRRSDGQITFSLTERRVLYGLSQGMSYEEISRRWGLSRKVVGNAAYAIRGKLYASTNEEAVTRAWQLGAVPDEEAIGPSTD